MVAYGHKSGLLARSDRPLAQIGSADRASEHVSDLVRPGVVEELPVPGDGPIRSDRIGHLPARQGSGHTRFKTRCARSASNSTAARCCASWRTPAQEIAGLYKRRWAIELFFRWVKQTLKIRRFLGTSQNAVRIQIAVALIAVLLLRLAQAGQKAVKSPLAFARLVRLNRMHRTADHSTNCSTPNRRSPQIRTNDASLEPNLNPTARATSPAKTRQDPKIDQFTTRASFGRRLVAGLPCLFSQIVRGSGGGRGAELQGYRRCRKVEIGAAKCVDQAPQSEALQKGRAHRRRGEFAPHDQCVLHHIDDPLHF
jgi:transposase